MFCGVHFMAESADVLTGDHQQVILPDLNAGCSMADMADIDSVEEAWDDLAQVTDIDRLVPITYMNSVGRPQGLRRPPRRRRVHLVQRPGRARPGRSSRRRPRSSSSPTSTSAATPATSWASAPTTCGSGTRARTSAASTDVEVKESTFLLWKGHCSVHQRFRPEHVEAFRAEHPDGIVMVHPECAHEVVELGRRQVGSTDFIIQAVEAAPAGSVIGVATEIHLVQAARPTRRPTRRSSPSTR